MNAPNIQAGDRICGFKVEQVTDLPKLSNRMIRLRHEVTGAQMIHLENQDDNNLFAVGFPTTPMDSTGVAHILEHTALCGSKRYPVRDPFFSMIKRSLKTFMNAFTASDWTMYPFSTQNAKDFDNLLGIYLDAAFFPLLSRLNFLQEGHRLEFENPEDPESPLVYKGVVYNEMLGAMSQQSQIMYRNLGRALFPTLTYQHNSGGDPERILDLTHDDLVAFHQNHYHPSNAYFFTYGNLPLAGHLEKIEAQVLSKFDPITVHTAVGREVRYRQPERFDFTYALDAADDDGKKCQASLAWLTSDVRESVEVLTLDLLNQVLLGHAGAPLRKALLESKLGSALSDGTGLESEIRECWFAAGLQGIAADDFGKVEALVLRTLSEVTAKGIDPEEVESALHQMEMDAREITGGHYPYSINLLFRFFGAWIHGGDAAQAIDLDASLKELKHRLEQPGYLEGKIKEYFLENQHRVLVTLSPDVTLEKRRAEERKAKLEQIRQSLSAEQRQQILTEQKALADLQEAEEDLSVLPTLKIEDIPEGVRFQDPVLEGLEGHDVTLYQSPTNGISYLQCYFKLEGVTDAERQYLPLLGSLLTQTGKGDLNYEQMSALINRYTGGFSAGPSLRRKLEGEGFEEFFAVGTKALHPNLPKAFELLLKILSEGHFKEVERIATLVNQRSTNLTNSVIQSGHQYASALASRNFSAATKIDSLYDGISQVQFMKELAKVEPPVLVERLNPFLSLLEKLFTANRLTVFALGEEESLETLKAQIKALYAALPAGSDLSGPPPAAQSSDADLREAWVTSTPVNYVAKAFKVPRYLSQEAPKLLVLANLLRSEFLHGEIREKGGAYGGMAGYNANEGIFNLLSYRDPQLSRTLGVYEKVPQWIAAGKFKQQAVDEAILTAVSSLDTPKSPLGKALGEYGNLRKGKTHDQRLAFRKALLATTRQELIDLGQKWLTQGGSIATITSNDQLEKEAQALSAMALKKHNI
ncbi:MAG: insulinase family protein [bacterium]|nr:insulinase family protein [bacterium]